VHKPHYLILSITWTVIVTVLSLAKIEGLDTPINIPNKDKVVHFVFYFLFYMLWFFYFCPKKSNAHLLWIVLLVSVGYGLLMEALQGVVGTNRTPDLNDVYANTFGAFCALLVSVYFLLKKRQI
jgi:VanZ family protein